MRTFIALPLPSEIQERLSTIQERLKKNGADVSWVKPHNIHLTLKFLGERDEKMIKSIGEILEQVAGDTQPFYLRLSSPGAFPGINAPRVIWMGIDKGAEETKILAQELEDKIARAGIPKEKRPFSCHITIGRVRSGLNIQKLTEELKRIQTQTGDLTAGIPEKPGQDTSRFEFSVDKVILYASTLTPQGPVYQPVKIANLRII